jgi:peptide deformylase
MAARPLTYYDNPILRQKAKRVTRFDGSLQKLIDDMVDTMHAEHGVGLAAPQVGVSLRLCVVELPEDYEDPLAGKLIVLANPEIVKATELYEVEEGCLSVPGYVANVKRYRHVTVKGRDRHGKEVRYKGSDLLAQAFQHEIDHLNGVLYVDRLESRDQLRPVRRVGEAEEETAATSAGGEPHPSRGYRG